MTTTVLNNPVLQLAPRRTREASAVVMAALRAFVLRAAQRRAARALLERADTLQRSQPSYAADLRAAAELALAR
jgi:hypothetical protein